MSETLPIDRAAINRANSLKSTGPKTDAGKQKSSLNSLRHGLTGQIVVMPSEDLSEYEAFTDRYHDEYKPSGPTETQLVQSLADDAWRLNRAVFLETNLISMIGHAKSHLVATDTGEGQESMAFALVLGEHYKSLATLGLHQQRIARTSKQTLKLLRELQAERHEKERIEMRRAACVYLYQVQQKKAAGTTEPYDPACDGFVFTAAQIEQHLYREQLYSDALSANLKYHSAA
jgi:hypothetical protein